MNKPERICRNCKKTIPAGEEFCPNCTAGYDKPMKDLTPRQIRFEERIELFAALIGVIILPVIAYYSMTYLGAVFYAKIGKTAFIFIVLVIGSILFPFWLRALKYVVTNLFKNKRK